MEEVEEVTSDAGSVEDAEPAADVKAEIAVPPKLLPMRLSPFAPPDPVAEARTSARLRQMSFSQLRNRRARIDTRLFELGLSVGEPALEVPSVRGTGLVDIDRIARKIDHLDMAREQVSMEREAEGKRKLFGSIDLSWLSDAFRFREIRARHSLLTSELGLALCASDLQRLGEYAPHVRKLLEEHVLTARRIDELFTEMRLVDDEFLRREHEGVKEEQPKEIDKMISKALDSVDDVSSKAVDTITDLTKSAAKSAVSGGGQAMWGIVRESAKGAIELGSRTLGRIGRGEQGEDENSDIDAPVPPPQPVAQAVVESRRRESSSIPDLLRQLSRLRGEGIITEDEFATKKAELLRRL